MKSVPRVHRSRLLVLLCLVFLAGGLFTAAASDGTENPQWVEPGLILDTSLSAAVNYLGLKLTNNLTYRVPLIKDNGLLWKSTKFEIGISDDLTPSYHRISALMMIEPIAFFDLKVLAGYDLEWAALTGGIYDIVQDPAEITEWGEEYADVYIESTRQTAHGFRLKVMPTVKMAVGPVAATYTFTLGYHAYNVHTDSGYYYDPETATIQQINDLYFVHDAKLIGRFLDFMVGANFIYTDLYSWDYSNMKLAGLFVYTPSWKVLPEHINPYAILQLGSFIRDQYNRGKFSAAAVLGVNFKLM